MSLERHEKTTSGFLELGWKQKEAQLLNIPTLL